MKKLYFLVLISFSVGCKQESGCTEFGSDNYDPDAIVDDGSCIPARDKFLGDFQVSSDCFSSGYAVNIAPATKNDEVILSNVSDTLTDVTAKVFLNEITIEDQSVGIGVSIEGAGLSLGQDTISLSYRISIIRNGMEEIHDCFEEFVRM